MRVLLCAFLAALAMCHTPTVVCAEDAVKVTDPFAANPRPTAKPKAPRQLAPRGASAEPAGLAIHRTLDAPLRSTIQVVELPLSEVLEQLSQQHGLRVVIDEAGLEEVGASSDTEVSLYLSGVTLRSAINHVLRSPGLEDLTYTVADEALLITTTDRERTMLETRVYYVKDLPYWPTESGSGDEEESPDSCSPLVAAILDCVERETWMEHGTGEGSLRVLQSGVLIVYQTDRVHRKIRLLLDDIRSVGKTDPSRWQLQNKKPRRGLRRAGLSYAEQRLRLPIRRGRRGS